MLTQISSSLAGLEHRPRRLTVALGLITLLAAVLRIYKLGQWSFWLDEIYTIRHALTHYGSLEATLRSVPPSGIWFPPSAILTAGALNAFGTNEFSARVVSAMIGLISVPVLYFPVKRLFGPGVGLVTALLLAVSPWHIYWSQNARFYTSLMLLYSLALFLFFLGLERDRPGYLVLSIVLLYLAASERLFALFMVPVVVCYLLVLKMAHFEKPAGLRARNLVLISAPAVAFGLLEVYKFVTTGSSMLIYAADVFAGKPIDDPVRITILLAFNIGIPLVCLASAGGVYVVLQKSRAGLFLVVWAVVPPLILAALNPFFFTVDRFVFGALPGWIVLCAVAVHELCCRTPDRLKLLGAAVLLVLVAGAAGENLMYYQINHGNRLEWRQAFRDVQEMKEEGDIIVSAVPEVGTHYTGEDVLALGDIDPDTVLAGESRYWFVIDSQHSWWAGKQKIWVEENCRLLKMQYLRVRETFDLSIYLCDPEHL